MRIRLTLLLIGIACVFSSCEKVYTTLSGKTMGTYYSIQYSASENYQPQIDSILNSFISAASTYDPTSEISQFNKRGEVVFKTPYLFQMLTLARDIHHLTDGAFEPTLMPVINARGFGYEKVNVRDDHRIDSLMALVSFDYIEFNAHKLSATKRGVQLDLSAMGEGFAIDLISAFLDKMHVRDYKVEIGGEMKCKGRNPKNERWLVGIENPLLNNEVVDYVRLQNEAISTSGSYRKFKIDNSGIQRSHIIDPKTGNSIENNLLSVTIINNSATFADAIATACMVMGADSARAFLNAHDLTGIITYDDNGKLITWKSKALSPAMAATN